MFPVSKVHYGHLIHGPNRVSASIVSRFFPWAPFGMPGPPYCGSFARGALLWRHVRFTSLQTPRNPLRLRQAKTSARQLPAWPPSRKGCRVGQVLPAVPPACTPGGPARPAGTGHRRRSRDHGTIQSSPEPSRRLQLAPRRQGRLAASGSSQARPSASSPEPMAPVRAGPPRSRGPCLRSERRWNDALKPDVAPETGLGVGPRRETGMIPGDAVDPASVSNMPKSSAPLSAAGRPAAAITSTASRHDETHRLARR